MSVLQNFNESITDFRPYYFFNALRISIKLMSKTVGEFVHEIEYKILNVTFVEIALISRLTREYIRTHIHARNLPDALSVRDIADVVTGPCLRPFMRL